MVVTFLTVHQRPGSLYRICRGTGLSPGTVDHVLESLEKDDNMERLVAGSLATRWLLKEQQDTAGEPAIVPAIKTSVFSYRDKQVIWRLVLDTRIYSFLRNNGPTSDKELGTRLPVSDTTMHRRLTALAERGIVEKVAFRELRGKPIKFWYLKPGNKHESKLLNEQLGKLRNERDTF
ncbi:MAG: winged helix-turn-helix transcriptional regulator [Candidatus Odinarchaeota archaeon]